MRNLYSSNCGIISTQFDKINNYDKIREILKQNKMQNVILSVDDLNIINKFKQNLNVDVYGITVNNEDNKNEQLLNINMEDFYKIQANYYKHCLIISEAKIVIFVTNKIQEFYREYTFAKATGKICFVVNV